MIFIKHINDKCILYKNYDISQEHVFNDYAKTEKLRTKLIKELNNLDNATKNITLLDFIFNLHYNKNLRNKKSDNKNISLFILLLRLNMIIRVGE